MQSVSASQRLSNVFEFSAFGSSFSLALAYALCKKLVPH